MSTPQDFLIEENNKAHSRSCRDCGRVLRVGQVVYEMQMPNNNWNDRYFSVHVTCLRARTEQAPQDQTKAEFEALRERILVTGQAFPD